jgi:translocation and assembly module TamA
LCLCACATVGPPQDGRPVLVRLRFEGNAHFSDSDLTGHIATTPSSGPFFKRVLRTWDADVFELDRERLERFYRMRGFFSAKVGAPRVEAEGGGGPVLVTVPIDEGPRTRVVHLLLAGLGGKDGVSAEEQRQVAGKLPLKEGADFDEDLYEKSKTALALALRERGLADAKVTGDATISPGDATATVTFTCAPGPVYRLGRVLVVGNRAIPTDLIGHATGLERGDLFAPSKLDLAQQRVYNLGVFSGARVSLEPLGDDPVAAVRVSVREAPFQTVRVGLGVQLEQQRIELPRLRLEYTNRNFFGGARRLELTTQVGYALIGSVTAPDKTGLVTQSAAQLTLPQLFLGLDFVNRGEFARELQPGFNYNQIAAHTALLLRRGKLSMAGSFNFVRTFAAVLDLDLSALITKGGGAAAALSNCVPACSLPYPELRVTFDARDDLVEPRLGFFVSSGVAFTLPGTSFNYVKFDPELRLYFPAGSLVTVALRGQLGGLVQPQGANALATPFNQRFFGGGPTLLRGYDNQQQGPRLGAQPVGDFATAAVPIGGNGMALGSLELRMKTDAVLKNSMVVPFVDVGRVTEGWSDVFTGLPEFAAGLGLRYLTPFGPARFDVGVLVNPEAFSARLPGAGTTAVASVVSASCGTLEHCLPLSRFAWHLTLGEAF